MNNYAFIDSQNLNLAIRDCGWKLDFLKFRKYLRDKYKITKAYLFIGYLPGNEKLYTKLQDMGYICIFKPTIQLFGKTKGNVDAELVLHTILQIEKFDKALIVTGDGDFYCLIKYLIEVNKLSKLLVPDENSYSSLFNELSKENNNILDFVNRQREKLEYK